MKKRKSINKETVANRFIDEIFHPLYKKDKTYIIIDGLMHSIIEQNPKKSFKKFLRYSLKQLIKQ